MCPRDRGRSKVGLWAQTPQKCRNAQRAADVAAERQRTETRCQEPSWKGLIDFGAVAFLTAASCERQIDAGAAMLEGLQFVDLPFGLPVAPRLGDSVSNGLQVLALSSSRNAASRRSQTRVRLSARRHMLVVPLRSTARNCIAKRRIVVNSADPRFQRIDAGGLSCGHLAWVVTKRRRGQRRDRPTGHRIQRSHADRS